MLFVFIYVNGCPKLFSYQMMFMSFNEYDRCHLWSTNNCSSFRRP